MFESSEIQLSRKALKNNLHFIRNLLQPGVRLCSVVKGNAYGHGLMPFVNMAIAEGVDYFAVHSAEEAYNLKNKVDGNPDIFIMGNIESVATTWAVNEDIEFSVFDFDRLSAAIHAAAQANKPAKIHLELETGMQRTGFNLEQLPQVCEVINRHPESLKLQGVFTHLAGAEDNSNDERVRKQQYFFYEMLAQVHNAGLHPVHHHLSCSAGIINYPEAQGNMVRIGIVQYGFWPNQETKKRFLEKHHLQNKNLLLRVISWRSKVMALHAVEKGNFIGYGSAFLAPRDIFLAIVPVGYAHGYNRNLSNIGSVIINGKTAPVIGVVNMNSLSVDVSQCGPVRKGDEVVLIGKQRGKEITINSFSEQSQLLNYEMLTRLQESIPRKIVK